ncbi:MAG: hypothetical protein E3J87_11095 [Candidatus Cloacimonadota bacterium]|nr:MAG: hypothetical protein E3J87_11095 [Candidatus Cloacimonadota bacterium]
MKNLKMLLFLFLLLPTFLDAETPVVTKKFLLSKQKAGYVEIGMSIDALYTKYGRESTKLVDLYLEGMFSPAIEIFLNTEKDKPSLVAEIGLSPSGSSKAFIVSRITVYDDSFRTEKGMGVGSTLGDLRKHHQINWIELGEGGLIARSDELMMSFVLFLVDIPEEWYMTRDMELIPDSTKIVSIFIN